MNVTKHQRESQCRTIALTEMNSTPKIEKYEQNQEKIRKN